MRNTRSWRRAVPLFIAALALAGAPSLVPAGPLEEGRAAIEAGNFADALRLLMPLAQEGNPGAQRAIGVLYAQGSGVTQDYGAAAQWFGKAAAQGDEKARQNLLLLAQMYRVGEGVPQDCARAVAIMKGLIALGYLPAQVNLGSLYFGGCGSIPADVKEGVRLTREAAEKGDPMAQANLGACCAMGVGVEQDYAAAMQWYRKAAEQGSPQGQYGVGVMYEFGEGVPRDLDEARRWYQLAAAQGEERSIARLEALKTGAGGAPDPESFLREAAMRASASDLAKGYSFVMLMQQMLPMAESGGTLQVGEQAITRENYQAAKADYDLRQKVYASVIRERGFKDVGGRYEATARPACRNAQSMWARAVLEGRAREVEIKQDGFELRIIQHWETGPEHAFDATAAVVESSLAFADPANSDYFLLGTVADGVITVRPDADAILSGWPGWVKAPSRKALTDCAVTLTKAK